MAHFSTSSLRYNVLTAVMELRGACLAQIVDYLDGCGFEFKSNSLSVTISKLVDDGFLRQDRQACCDCKRDNVYYYATDQARIVYL